MPSTSSESGKQLLQHQERASSGSSIRRRAFLSGTAAWTLFLLISALIVLSLAYFKWPSTRGRYYESDGGRTVVVSNAETQSVELDRPLNPKDAFAACGARLDLNNGGIAKLYLVGRLDTLVDNSEFTTRELKWRSDRDLNGDAFSAYAGAYFSWDDPTSVSQERRHRGVKSIILSVLPSKVSPDDEKPFRIFVSKYIQMMFHAFDLGRHDARLSPCPFQ
jgi:hypothetical protein